MVQISKSLIIAAAIAPAFAAPAIVESSPLEAREPRRVNKASLRKAERVGSKVFSVGASVAPLFIQNQQQQQQRDLADDAEIETREPKLTRTQWKLIGKGLGQAGHKLKSGVEFGATVGALLPLRQQNQNQNQPRSVEDLESREPKFNFGRLRLPSHSTLRKIGGGAAAAAGFGGAVAATQFQQRDFEDLNSREPRFSLRRLRLPSHNTLRKIGGGAAAAAGFGGAVAATQLQQREDEDFYARENENEQIYLREYEDADIEAREPEFDIDMREIAEFDELD